MDRSSSDRLAGGACAGHGGVRFWVYKTETGDTLHYATWRHKEQDYHSAMIGYGSPDGVGKWQNPPSFMIF